MQNIQYYQQTFDNWRNQLNSESLLTLRIKWWQFVKWLKIVSSQHGSIHGNILTNGMLLFSVTDSVVLFVYWIN